MSFTFQGGVFVPDPVTWNYFVRAPQGTVGRDLRRRGHTLAFLAAGTVGKESGRLSRSIKSTYYPAAIPYVEVGSNLKYALIEHEGSRPHIIVPNKRTTLRFKVRGRVVYTQKVRHPGTKGSRYLTRHLRRVVND